MPQPRLRYDPSLTPEDRAFLEQRLGPASATAPTSNFKTVSVEGQTIQVPNDATPDEIDQIFQAKRTAAGVQAPQQDGPDIVGRVKRFLTKEPAPGERSMFGEPEILAPVARGIRTAGEFFLPGSKGEALATGAIGTVTGPLRPVAGAIASRVAGLPGVKQTLDIGRKAISGGIEAAGELFRPGVIREAGAEVAAGKMGQPIASTTRALGEKASKKAYEEASQVAGKVDVSSFIDDALKDVTSVSNPSPKVVRYLDNMKKKLSGSQDYTVLKRELDGLRNQAEGALRQGRNAEGRAFYELRTQALDKMDDLSPSIKQANAIYRNEETAKSVLSVLRRPSAGTKMRELFENDSLIAHTFKDRPGTVDELYRIADKLGSIASESPMGLGNRILGAMNNLSEVVISDEKARAMLRWALDSTTKANLSSLPKKINQVGQLVRSLTFEDEY